MTSIKASWTQIKSFADQRGVSVQYVDFNGNYFISVIDGTFSVETLISKEDANNADLLDFEANYKANGNKRIGQIDSDGAPLARIKAAPTGWTFQLRGFEFQTSALDSVINYSETGSALSDISIKLYKANGDEITTPGIANVNLLACVKTVVDFEPAYDYYIIGAKMRVLTALNSDVRVTAIVVPDISYQNGGSRVLAQNVNFRYIAAGDKFDADGRAAKFLAYNATYHTNKIRLIINHAAGAQHSFSLNIEHFKF